MSNIRILIVEDEVIIADNMADILAGYGYDVIGIASSYYQAVELIEENIPDIAIIDIKIKGRKSGIDLAEFINDEYQFPFIFLSSNSDSETLSEAKAVEPQTFLVKPFNDKELFTSIEVALHNFARNKKALESSSVAIKESLFIKKESSFLRLDFADIMFIKSNSVYVDIHTIYGNTELVRGSLGDYTNRLNANFFRCHRSCIVNLEYIQEIKQNS
ncbi:MAG: DNA-binding response regulator, partial [Bacteroidetes bacterium]|nr:DNA-binding response regulator [Bacteroidota bacterium]